MKFDKELIKDCLREQGCEHLGTAGNMDTAIQITKSVAKTDSKLRNFLEMMEDSPSEYAADLIIKNKKMLEG